MKNLRSALFKSVISLILCFSMLLGTTYAWFTDTVTSGNNIIKAGNLDLQIFWTDDITDSNSWRDAEDASAGAIFDYDRWEPGYTCVRYIKIVNNGTLAFKYIMNILPDGEMGILADVIDVYYMDNYNVDASGKISSIGGMTKAGTLADVVTKKVSSEGKLLPKDATNSGESIVAIAMNMQESADNRYQGKSIGTTFSIEFLATQLAYEEDAFGPEYDKDSDYTVFEGDFVYSHDVRTTDNVVQEETSATSENGEVTSKVNPGTKVKDGVTKLTVAVSTLEKTSSNMEARENEVLIPVDVHVEGIAEDNTVPVIVALDKFFDPGLNLGNYELAHVEDGVTNIMTSVSSPAELDAHNEYYYDPATGTVSVALCSFSEVVAVRSTEGVWEGNFDYSWYDASKTEYTIANADQLAAFGAIVGGMKKVTGRVDGKYTYSDEVIQDSFAGKTVKLLADIDLGDKESENNPDIIFHPIGYWNNEGTYERKPTNERTEAVSSGFYAFEGTFDGNGNTISNFYQNTWEIKGDHDWYSAVTEQYFRDGMGLFGKVYGGTVKNLTIDNFSSDGEITTTGVIAAYADSKEGQPAIFENIAITNCNPRVYNIGNGGIVGCAGWYSKDNKLGNDDYTNAVVFRNITVDQTNKISALWGTYDVSCGGILGQYYPNSGCGIKLENCHVSAIIDVNNDVCANYQYYWYRYSGMFIGTIRANTKDGSGYTVADPTGITATDCTYSYGSWNEYWYCELVKNSSASYTHDYQFGRLDNINDLSEIKSGETWLKEGNFALVSDDRKSVECYHIFKDSNGNLYRHFHDVADESNPNIYEDFDLNGDGELNDLKEDRQRYYLPFGQVFNGLGYGVKPTYTYDGFKLVEDGTVISGEKFKVKGGADLTYRPGETVYLKDLVNLVVDASKLSQSSLYVSASPVDEDGTVSIKYNRDVENWENNNFVISNDTKGAIKIVITDYFYCTATVITLNEETAVEKFTATNVAAQNAYTQVALGTLFGVKGGATIGNVTATVTDPAGNETTVSGTSSDWATKTINLTKDGTWTVAIKDDDAYCQVTTVTFEVNKVDKFTKKFDKDFLYRVGNANEFNIGYIFGENITDYPVGLSSVNVTIENVAGNAAGAFTSNATWNNGTVKFEGTGVVKVTISADGANPVELHLEVVDATNVTGLSGTISGNVVLLNDCGLSSLTVSGRNTVYGNGFTATYSGNGQYLNNGLKQGVITVSGNGMLDNLHVKASIYPIAALYSDQIKDYYEKEGDKTRYFYQLSAVAISGDATISNCYIYGGRNNVYVGSGNVTIKNTVLERGTVANMQVFSSDEYTVTLENLTTIQSQSKPTTYANDKLKENTLLGFGVLVGDGDGETAETNPKFILKGYLKQYNWVTGDDQDAVSDTYAKTAIGAALGKTAYQHTINGKTAANLGFVFLNTENVTVDNQTGLNYQEETIKILTVSGKVYAISGATENQIFSDVVNADRTTVNALYKPQFKFDDDLGGQYIAKTDDGDEFLYREGDTIKVMFPSGDSKEIDLAALVDIQKYGNQNLNLAIACKDEQGNPVSVSNGKVTLSAAGAYTVTYTVTDSLFYDKDGNVVEQTIAYSWDVIVDVALKDVALPSAYFAFDSSVQKIFRSGNSSIVQFIPFLSGLKIYDYDVSGNEYLRFDGGNTSTTTDYNKIAKATIENKVESEGEGNHIVTIELTDGGKLIIDLDVRADSGSGTHTGSIKVRNNVIYVANNGTTSGKGQTWNVYSYKFVGNNGTEINSGKVIFGTKGTDCDTATKPSSNFGTTVKYTVTYNANEGNCVQTLGYATSAATAVTLPAPARSGYVFAGWYTAASGGTRVGGAGDSYTPSANVTLYAQWSAPFNVTYDANGGSCAVASETYRGTSLKLPTPTRDGYWFIGWYDAATGGNKIGDAGSAYDPKKEIILYAHWQQAIAYTVTYDANGGSVSTTSATYEGTALTLPTPAARTGYTFNGWYTAASGGTKIGGAGASYIPSANITLYAQWTVNQYTLSLSISNATVTVNGTKYTSNQTLSVDYGSDVSVTLNSFSQSRDKTFTISGGNINVNDTTPGKTHTFVMPDTTVTITAKSSSTCVTADTLVTLADGSQKRIDAVTNDDLLLVWDFYSGEYAVVPSALVQNHGYGWNTVIKMTYSDGTVTKAVNEHGYFDATLNEFVMITADNVEEYIGHEFVKADGDSYTTVTLMSAEVTNEYTEAYSILTVYHFNFIADDMFSLTSPTIETNVFMPFEVGENMTFDAEKMEAAIAEFGLYEYEDFEGQIPYEVFDALNFKYLKVTLGKNLVADDQVLELLKSAGVIG